MNIVLSLNGSTLKPYDISAYGDTIVVTALPPSRIDLGFSLSPTKVTCAECGTPVLEIVGGSVVIKSRHHSQRHTTAIAISALTKLAQNGRI